MGNAASPLRKTLIDSQLGTALCDAAGFDAENRDTMFVCGLKDVAESDGPEIESIIYKTLGELVTKGIDTKLIESAIHQVEFHRKEVTNSPYPYGIKQLLIIAGSWLHGGDPVSRLQLDDELQKLRIRMSQGPFFEECIKKYFLQNSHRVLFRLVPDQTMEDNDRKTLAAQLKKIKAGMSPSILEKLVRDAESLKKLQETDEDISSLPTLAREDIPPAVPRVNPSTSLTYIPANCYEQQTSGIFYLAMAAGVGSLEKQMLPLVPFVCFALPKIGTALREYTDMAQRIDLYTGGLRLSAHARTGFDRAGICVPFISLNTKCLNRNLGAMFEIFEELLLHFDFSDLSRLKALLLEYRANLEAMIIHNGHRLAISRASRNFSTARKLSEIWSGVHLVQTIKSLTDDLTENRLQSIAADLTTICNKLFGPTNVKMALIGEEAAYVQATDPLSNIVKKLKDTPDATDSKPAFSSPSVEIDDEVPREGWSIATAVSFVAQSFETVRLEHQDAPALAVISKILRSMYLHREIREKGGAYGGFALYNSEDGLFSFASYRDPHIVSTLKVFDRAADFIRSGDYSEEDIDEAILQICADIDKPDSPGTAARKAFFREIISLSDEARQNYKERILALTRKEVLKTAEKYFNSQNHRKAVAVISGEQHLEAANQNLSEQPLKLYRL